MLASNSGNKEMKQQEPREWRQPRKSSRCQQACWVVLGSQIAGGTGTTASASLAPLGTTCHRDDPSVQEKPQHRMCCHLAIKYAQSKLDIWRQKKTENSYSDNKGITSNLSSDTQYFCI